MRRMLPGVVLLASLSCLTFLSNSISAQQKNPSEPDPELRIRQEREKLAAGDLLEWVSLVFGSTPSPPAEAISRLRRAVEGRTTLLLHPLQRYVTYRTERLTRHPFLHSEMCSQPPVMDLKSRFRWRDFFSNGGFMFLDVCPQNHSENNKDAIADSWKSWGKSIFPDTGWSPLNRGHELSYSFYLLDKRMFLGERKTLVSLLEQDGRVILVHNRSRRWSWDTLKNSTVSVNLNEPLLEIHLRLYINLLMLMLTGDYKSDQLHLPTILLRRR